MGNKAMNTFGSATKSAKKGDYLEGYKQMHVGWGGSNEDFEQTVGLSTKNQEKAMAEQRRQREKEMKKSRKILDQMNKTDKGYREKLGQLRDEASKQASDAQTTYTNDIQPRFKNIMEDAQREAGSAMTLQQAGDPNNAVHQAVRQLYDQQAQGVRKQSLADVGVLNALGAQATAQQMGAYGSPVTGAQLQLMNAGNQQQSGLAYARAQQQMQRLREQGLERGFSESSAQYNRGQDAKDRYSNSVANFEGAMDRNTGRQRDARGENLSYTDARVGNKQGTRARDLAYTQSLYGGKREDLNAQIAMQNAQNAQRAAVIGSGVSAVGNYYGMRGAGNGISQSGGGQAPTQQTYQGADYGMYDQRPNPYQTQRYSASQRTA